MKSFDYNNYLKISLVIVLISCFGGNSFGQLSSSDIDFLTDTASLPSNDTLNTKTFLVAKSINPMKWLAAGALYGYQIAISPQIPSNCPYQMSCSNFAKYSILEFGLTKGVFFTADRLSRCNHPSTQTYAPIRISPTGKIIDFPNFYRWR